MDAPPPDSRFHQASPPEEEPEAAPLALRIVAGTYEGSEFPLLAERSVVIGRARDADIILLGDDRVSRRHARLFTRDGSLHIEDLGSTNGTFVNGAQIDLTEIGLGDSIAVGGSTMRVGRAGAELSTSAAARMQVAEAAEMRDTRSRYIMRGELSEIPLSALLQLLTPSRKSGLISLSNDDMRGRVHLRKGRVLFAALDDWTTPPLDSLKALMRWTEGTFEVGPDDGEIFAEEISDPLEAILMEMIADDDDEPITAVADKLVDAPTLQVSQELVESAGATVARSLNPKEATGEELSLVEIPWRKDMDEAFDREAVFAAAVALNGHSDRDWETLREVASLTLTWSDALLEGFGEVHGDAFRCAVLFEDGREPVGDDELQAWRNLVESWLAGILPGQGTDRFFRETWVAGLVHLGRGVRNVYLISWMARLQRLFRDRCVGAFELERALSVSDAFNRITDTAVALACESREAGIMESVSRIGINESLLRRIQGQAVSQLITRERETS